MMGKFSTASKIIIPLVVIGCFVTGAILFMGLSQRQSQPGSSTRSPVPTVKGTGQKSLNLPIAFAAGKNSEMIPYFNSIARDGDAIGFTEDTVDELGAEGFRSLVSTITKGDVQYNFASWQTAQEKAANLKGLVDYLTYDLERWDKSRGEWQDIAAASQQMRRVTSENNFSYIAGLSNSLSKQASSVEAVSPPADVYNIHAHGYFKTNDLAGYVAYARNEAARAKAANPSIKIELLVSTTQSQSAQELYEKLILPSLDFTSQIFIYHLGGGEPAKTKMKELVALMRP